MLPDTWVAHTMKDALGYSDTEEYREFARRRAELQAVLGSYSGMGKVYFVGAYKLYTGRRSAMFLKIGWTEVGVLKRIEKMQVGCPLELHSILVIPGGMEQEKIIQGMLVDHRVVGEWFKPHEDVWNLFDLLDIGIRE